MDKSDCIPGIVCYENVTYILLENYKLVPIILYNILSNLNEKQLQYVCEKYCEESEECELDSKARINQQILCTIMFYREKLFECVKEKGPRSWYLVEPLDCGDYSVMFNSEVMGRVPKKD
jgi:hypothetical protein